MAIGNDICIAKKELLSGATTFIGNPNEICRIGIIQSPTIESLQNDLQKLRKEFYELKAMLEFHPDNHDEMENRKEHFDSLVTSQKK